MLPKSTALVGMGANLGKRQAAIRAALDRIGRIAQTRVIAVATLRETEPVDAPEGSPRFMNTAAAVETSLGAEVFLGELLRIERELGRTREGESRNAPRVIDLDLLMVGDLVVQTEALVLPHPRMHLRRFVLEPLAEIAPGVVHPMLKKTMGELLAALGD